MVDYRTVKSVAVLEVNNPPVNALSYNVRQGLQDGIERANKDKEIKSIIIIGKGRTYPAGADISEFSKPHKGPNLIEVGLGIESSRKPVISAIHGTCLGGGLEIALFSHYRIALESAKVGFPEVALGLLPGAHGTQRLPRVAGMAFAMEIITSGRHVSAREALQHGILDKLVKGNLLSESLDFAASLPFSVPHNRRLRNVPAKGAENADRIFEVALNKVKQKQNGFIAPINCLKAVKAALLPYEEGAKIERELFMELLTSGQAKAQQYVFFAERAATRWYVSNEKNQKKCSAVPVKTTGVIGAGTMGSGIVVTLLRAGLPVILVEQDSQNLERGVNMIKGILQGSVNLKRMTSQQMNKCLQQLTPAQSLDSLHNVDLVIEAVFENLKLKEEIFGKLDEICKQQTILCSNTSTLDIDKIARATKRPDKVIGTHFFAPAFVMPLLENVYGTKTSGETIATVMNLGKTIRKIPVLVKTCHGFVANRMLARYQTEASFLLEEGCLPHEYDQVMEEFGFPMGAFKVGDLSGLDIGYRIRQELAKANGYTVTTDTRYIQGERFSSLADKLYELGRLGRKTGKGWYKYDRPGAKEAFVDPDVTDIILKHCKDAGIIRRKISTQEIVERSMYSSINEGFRCLEDGVASKPEDIDVIWLHGFGFPRYRGGPMYYASTIGLAEVYDRICYYHKTFPESSYWVPSDLLRKLATSGRNIPMSDWSTAATVNKSRL
ncbi:hypothetical protein SNE40_022645 [Patella caerulea]|uniref:Peroxisomal bifunctional enzyme n=1 Tax=Patella caerulea TaxID=87958 RepID=A0AAN8G8M7_PATCE